MIFNFFPAGGVPEVHVSIWKHALVILIAIQGRDRRVISLSFSAAIFTKRHYFMQLCFGEGGRQATLSLVWLSIATCLKFSFEAHLRALTVSVWAVQSIVLTITLNNRSHGKEFGLLKVLWWLHSKRVARDHLCMTGSSPLTATLSLTTFELVLLIKGRIDKVGGVVISLIIKRV